jgi:hypothetical protein
VPLLSRSPKDSGLLFAFQRELPGLGQPILNEREFAIASAKRGDTPADIGEKQTNP